MENEHEFSMFLIILDIEGNKLDDQEKIEGNKLYDQEKKIQTFTKHQKYKLVKRLLETITVWSYKSLHLTHANVHAPVPIKYDGDIFSFSAQMLIIRT